MNVALNYVTLVGLCYSVAICIDLCFSGALKSRWIGFFLLLCLQHFIMNLTNVLIKISQLCHSLFPMISYGFCIVSGVLTYLFVIDFCGILTSIDNLAACMFISQWPPTDLNIAKEIVSVLCSSS